MSAKILINGKEYDSANLSPELSTKLKGLLEDKDNNGVPDITDNPFTAIARLGQLASVAKEIPVLVGKIKTEAEKKNKGGKETGQISVETTQSSSQSMNQPSRPAPKNPAQDWLSASPPIKKDTGRMALFWLAVLGLIGWYVWQYFMK